MRISFRLLLGAAAATTFACRSSGTRTTAQEPAPQVGALSGLVTEKVAVAPTYTLRVAPGLAWAGSIGPHRDVQRQLDDGIAAVLADRGATKSWVFPPELVRSWERNSTYATDPYALGEEPLRSPALTAGARIPDPLASQLRTISALHDGRYVLLPVELRFEPDSTAGARAVRATLHLVLVDARLSEVRWTGVARSDPSPSFGPPVLASLATHVADMIVAP